MVLSDHLTLDNVIINLHVSSKRDLLAKMSELAARRVGLSSAPILKTLIAREELGSTGVGRGLALPHAMVPEISSPLCLFARTAKPISYQAIDGEPVDLVMLILNGPVQQGQNLNVLSCAARHLRSDEVLSVVRQAKTKEEVFLVLTRDE